MKVTLAGAAGMRQDEITFDLAAGATISDVIAIALGRGILAAEPGAHTAVGVWGRVKPHDWVLREGDRVELYQPLRIDPKLARRAKGRRVRGRVER